jgi:hypothetical protein
LSPCAKDTELIGYATEIRLRAERRAGELLKEMEKNKGARSQSHPKTGSSKQRPPVTDDTPKLSDLGVSKTQSSRWQKLADLDQDEFEAKVERGSLIADHLGARRIRNEEDRWARLRAVHFHQIDLHRIWRSPAVRYGAIERETILCHCSRLGGNRSGPARRLQ